MSQNFLSSLVGSFAQPAAENPTVAIMEAAFRHHGLDWRYLNCEVAPDDLGDAVRGARAMGWSGFNCSIPHKVAVVKHIDELGRSAEIIGAVNTAVRDGDRFIGENTDGQGFVESISAKTDLPGKKVVLFGAGGAARALAVELALAGVTEMTIVNRSPGRGEELVALLNARTPTSAIYVCWDGPFQLPAATDIVANATSIGLYPDVDAELAVDWSTLAETMIVADGVHNPPETHLIRMGRDRGCVVLDGLGMLVNVCAICIRLWTGVDVEKQVMHDAVVGLT
ncbi:MAG: shikimate dehydrogenase [Hyphomicrobiales bacterium]|nr:shikimate dehydrogenase [Hyphomicrobiales bacterium]